MISILFRFTARTIQCGYNFHQYFNITIARQKPAHMTLIVTNITPQYR